VPPVWLLGSLSPLLCRWPFSISAGTGALTTKGSRHVYGTVIKMMLLSVFLGSALEAIRQWVYEGLCGNTFSGALLICFGLGVLFLCLLYGALKIMKMSEMIDILEKPFQKITKRFHKNKEKDR
jgi:predicted PurR-regulated permease PerM